MSEIVKKSLADYPYDHRRFNVKLECCQNSSHEYPIKLLKSFFFKNPIPQFLVPLKNLSKKLCKIAFWSVFMQTKQP